VAVRPQLHRYTTPGDMIGLGAGAEVEEVLGTASLWAARLALERYVP